MGLSIDELVDNSPALMQNNAVDVRLSNIRQLHSKGDFPIVAAKAYTPKSRRKRQHKTWFVGKDKELPLHLQDEVLAQCSCENYMYMFEVANKHHGAAQIVYSNGEQPKVTNPSLSPGLCLSGKSLILTLDGSTRLEHIIPGDFILGTGGFKEVTAVAMTERHGSVAEVVFSNGYYLTMTLDHELLVTQADSIQEISSAIKRSYVESADIETHGFGYRSYYVPHLHYKALRDITVHDRVFFYKGETIRGAMDYKPTFDDFELVKIGSVSSILTEPVYDLTVDGGHFIANSIVIKNCKHLIKLAQVINQRGY